MFPKFEKIKKLKEKSSRPGKILASLATQVLFKKLGLIIPACIMHTNMKF